jgi:hypothetical protein
MMTVAVARLVAADANLARRRARLSARSERREPQVQGFSNRMLDVAVALMNAK